MTFVYPSSSETPSPATLKTDTADCPAIVQDIDNNTYRTVLIGQQCWLQSNLAVSRYTDGSPILNTDVFDKEIHGLLYKFEHTQHPSGLCPIGWLVPSDKDFQRLERFIGLSESELDANGWRGNQQQGRQLKNQDLVYWWDHWLGKVDPSIINKHGFSFTPSGAAFNGNIYGVNRFGDLWSRTASDHDKAWYRSVFWIFTASFTRGDVDKIKRKAVNKQWSFSVRCILSDHSTDK